MVHVHLRFQQKVFKYFMTLNSRSINSNNGDDDDDDDDDDKVTVNLILYFINHHVLKVYGGVEMSGYVCTPFGLPPVTTESD